MTSISEINSSSAAETIVKSEIAGVLGKEDFLRLLVAQLEHQDPLNPADPTEFTAQLAQFSSLEQLFNINDRLQSLAGANSEIERLTSLSLIGKEIIYQGGDFRVGEEDIDLGYGLEQPASKVTLYIKDQYGHTVATLTGNELGTGEHFITWDGLNETTGLRVAPGEYSLLVSAQAGENNIGVVPLVVGLVTGVDLDRSGSILLTSAGDFGLADIKSVRSF